MTLKIMDVHLWVCDNCGIMSSSPATCGECGELLQSVKFVRAPENKCSFDPTTYAGQPIGMFHCPECGEMVLAGVPHPNYNLLNEL